MTVPGLIVLFVVATVDVTFEKHRTLTERFFRAREVTDDSLKSRVSREPAPTGLLRLGPRRRPPVFAFPFSCLLSLSSCLFFFSSA